MAVARTSSVFRLAQQLLVFQLLIGVAFGRRFDSIDDCRARVVAANATTPALNLTFMLTLPQCYEYCGTGYGTYDTWSVISALTSWVIPLFLLLGNVTYAKISSSTTSLFRIVIFKHTYNLGYKGNWIAVISHLLANPIDFLWSLCIKLDRGRLIRNRCFKIKTLDDNERKNLTAISFALDDFKKGDLVDALLRPLDDPLRPLDDPSMYSSTRKAHCDALRPILGPTACDLADARKHNKLHSTLAILIYGKEVFEALIDAQLDGTFPYHMPHTLALRQIYYWLFLAIILSSAAGGFANQWTSHAILKRFLTERSNALKGLGLEGGIGQPNLIDLEPLEPWNGGNYSWRYPKDNYSWRHPKDNCDGGHPKDNASSRRVPLLFLVLLAVTLPVVSAFLISWFTPTVGLGDRGIMELSFAGLWVINWVLTYAASKCWGNERLFRIMWWNLFWSLGSLAVLFAAFQGELFHPLFQYLCAL